jgi:hypothetical protein
VAAAIETMKGITIGDPLDPKNFMGPLVSKHHRARVLHLIERARAAGGKVAYGGGIPKGHEKGYFIEPTLFVDVKPDDIIAQEEAFGPVLAVIPYQDEAEALRIANNSEYGLSATVAAATDEEALPSPTICVPVRSVSTGVCGCASTFPSAVTSKVAWDASSAWKAWLLTWKPRSSAYLLASRPRHSLGAKPNSDEKDMSVMNQAVIVDAVRTPMGRGKMGGALSSVHPSELLAAVFRALVDRNRLDPGTVDDVLVGCVSQAGEQSNTPGRMGWLSAGFPEHVPATTIERKCGSSQQAIHFAAQVSWRVSTTLPSPGESSR